MESDEAVDDASQHGRLQNGIVQPWGERGESRAVGEAGDGPRAKGHAVHFLVMLQKLGFEFGDIDTRWTFRLAGFAGKAEVHDLFDFLAVEGARGVGGISQHLTQDVGAGASGVFFLAGGHVARAHRAAGEVRLAALAHAGAFFRRPQDATGIGESKERLVPRWRLARKNPQGGIHRGRVDDLAGVEDTLRVERPLHTNEEVVAGLTHHRPDELAAEPAVAVLAAQGAAVFLHERRDVGGHVAKHLQTRRRVEVEQRPQVELTGAGVCIVDAVDAILLGEQPVELGDVGW